MTTRRKSLSSCLLIVTLAVIGILGLVTFAALIQLPQRAAQVYGPASPNLRFPQNLYLAFQLLQFQAELLEPADPQADEIGFEILLGETPGQVSRHLEQIGLIPNAVAFQRYLIYAGYDTHIQAGNYRLSPGLPAIQIAQALLDATPSEVTLVVLAGWRVEEVAASLNTTGLNIEPDQLVTEVQARQLEGFLLPGSYQFPRQTQAEQLVDQLLANFELAVTPEMRSGFSNQGLSLAEAVTLASIVEREAVVHDEMPLIASVFLNRLAIGMKLDADPTVQYAAGYNQAQNTWWTNPLTRNDLAIDSPYNTYLYPGLPPSPISNPSLEALRAVAFPAQTPYYYFRATCDGSGRHLFAETYQQHLNNACP
ncbi:MAG: endolytic transglycosylase MltG [Anaerolineales bacterium]|nr:endolytic transglycosylase MltG [Anaerolineales bacterium]